MRFSPRTSAKIIRSPSRSSAPRSRSAPFSTTTPTTPPPTASPPHDQSGVGSVLAASRLGSHAIADACLHAEFRGLKAGAIPEGELGGANDQLTGRLRLIVESATQIMSNVDDEQMYFERFFTM